MIEKAKDNVVVRIENMNEEDLPTAANTKKFDPSLDRIFGSKRGYFIYVSMTCLKGGIALVTYSPLFTGKKNENRVLHLREQDNDAVGSIDAKTYCRDELELECFGINGNELDSYAKGFQEAVSAALEKLNEMGSSIKAIHINTTLHVQFRAGEGFRARAKAGEEKYANAFRISASHYEVVLYEKLPLG